MSGGGRGRGGNITPRMAHSRRQFLSAAATALAAAHVVPLGAVQGTKGSMYGLIGKVTAVAGQRDALAKILLDGTTSMPGCFSYIVASDPADADALWITEVWDSEASHTASLQFPAVQAAIAKGRPLIAGFSNRVETTPLGGHGLVAAKTG